MRLAGELDSGTRTGNLGLGEECLSRHFLGQQQAGVCATFWKCTSGLQPGRRPSDALKEIPASPGEPGVLGLPSKQEAPVPGTLGTLAAGSFAAVPGASRTAA